MNQLKVSLQQTIVTLSSHGWSQRRIARELGLDRGTVAKYLRPEAKPATNPTHGSEPMAGSKPATDSTHGSTREPEAKPASNLTHGAKPGPASRSAPFTEQIKAGLTAGLSAQRIYQDLVRDHAFTGGYQSVKRFARSLAHKFELPFRRMECEPGAELQVDFGLGAWVIADGKRRRPHLFRAVLSHSRKGYSEVVWRQDTETVIRCLENAFRAFGGVTATLVPDSVKAGGEIGRRIELTIAANLLKLDIESDFLEPLKKRNGAYVGVGILLDAASRLGIATSDERVKAIRDRVAQALIAAQEDDGYIGYKPPADRVSKLFDPDKIAQIILGRSWRALPLLRATADKITKEAGLKGGADARTKV
jgi:transposase